MRRLIGITLALALLFSLCACGGGGASPAATSELRPSEPESSAIQEPEPLASKPVESSALEEPEEPEIATPTDQFVEAFRESENGLYAAALSYDKDTHCTEVIITSDVQVWLFSPEEDSPIVEVAVVGTYPDKDEDFQQFASDLAWTVAATMSIFDPGLELMDAGKAFTEMFAELGDNLYVEKEINGITYAVIEDSYSVSLGFKPYADESENPETSATDGSSLVIASNIAESPSEPESEPEPEPEVEALTVYYTKSGSKYHYENPCGNGTYYPCTLDQALAKGLGPCGKCVLH